MLKNVILVAVVGLALGMLFFAFRPDSPVAEPREREVEVRIDGEGAMNPDEISVNEGGRVNLRFLTERPNPVHIHGYDLHAGVEGGMAEMDFEADITGRFEIMEHPADYGEDHSHGEDRPIGVLIVEPR